MPSFQDSIFLFVLALLLLGPKKLPVLARELGKWLGEFRRASNEFKMQMEEELRLSEQEERQKKIAAMEAAAPPPPALEVPEGDSETSSGGMSSENPAEEAATDEPKEVLPIATSGDLNMMPPSTGFPMRRDIYEESGNEEEANFHGEPAPSLGMSSEEPIESKVESVTHVN